MELFPAIDLRDGMAVRLVQGDFGRQQAYGDPLALATRWMDGGARWLHVVDLDAARTGEPRNRELVLAIARTAAGRGVAVQAGGGVRTPEDAAALLDGGVSRVVLGTAALEDPDLAVRLATRHPGGVALGLDYRPGPEGQAVAASRGWEDSTGATVGQVLAAVAGAPLGAVVVTAIQRDGTLAGPDLTGLAAVLDATELEVVASGGVGTLVHLEALAALRSPGTGRSLAGAVVGKALVDGRMAVEEAVAACAR